MEIFELLPFPPLSPSLSLTLMTIKMEESSALPPSAADNTIPLFLFLRSFYGGRTLRQTLIAPPFVPSFLRSQSGFMNFAFAIQASRREAREGRAAASDGLVDNGT